MTRLLICIITAGCFCALASYSWGRYEPGHHQTHHAKAVQLVRKQTYAWATPRAAQLASVLGITPQELDGAMDIFGEGKRK